MTVLPVEQRTMIRNLERLPALYRVAFAAACAERLLPAYIRYSRNTGRGDSDGTAIILERLWRDLRGEEMNPDELRANLAFVEAAVPDYLNTEWTVDMPAADDAARALLYALTCRLTGKAQDAAWSARIACDAVFAYLIQQKVIDIRQRDPVRRGVSHPLYQAERARQNRDLNELLVASESERRSLVDRLRERAKSEAAAFFGQGSGDPV